MFVLINSCINYLCSSFIQFNRNSDIMEEVLNKKRTVMLWGGANDVPYQKQRLKENTIVSQRQPLNTLHYLASYNYSFFPRKKPYCLKPKWLKKLSDPNNSLGVSNVTEKYFKNYEQWSWIQNYKLDRRTGILRAIQKALLNRSI